jgi:hypothetical protein
MKTKLPPTVEKYIQAVNAGDAEALQSTFARDAVVKDVDREIRGIDAIRRWASHDIFGVHASLEVRKVVERDGETTVTVKIDGTFPRKGLPDPLLMDHTFKIAGGEIATLIVRFTPAAE